MAKQARAIKRTSAKRSKKARGVTLDTKRDAEKNAFMTLIDSGGDIEQAFRVLKSVYAQQTT